MGLIEEGPEYDLGAGKDYGTVHLECTHWACEGQQGDQAQPAWVTKGRSCLTNLISF